MKVHLNHHPIWTEFDKILAQVDMRAVVKAHIESCNYRVKGYWDDDDFYDEIAFVSPLRAELINSAFGETKINSHNHRWVRLHFVLKPDTAASQTEPNHDLEEIGELTLVFDTDWNVVDENWLIDVESPFVATKKGAPKVR